MKLFIDSSNIQSIKKFVDIGIIDGVTTNPTLLAMEGGNPADQVEKIVKLMLGPVSVEVLSSRYEEIIEEAKKISAIADNVVVKVPMTMDGIRAASELGKKGIKTNVTLVFSAPQALLAAKAGATYVSPFIGRLDDVGEDGISLIRDIVTIYKNYSFKTQIIVASVRHPVHIVEAAKIGADIATVPADVLEKMFAHPLTDVGLRKFRDDWEELKKKYDDVSLSKK